MKSIKKEIILLCEKNKWDISIKDDVINEADYDNNVTFINEMEKPSYNVMLTLLEENKTEIEKEKCLINRLNEYPPDALLARALFLKKAFDRNELFKECKKKIIEVDEKYPMSK